MDGSMEVMGVWPSGTTTWRQRKRDRHGRSSLARQPAPVTKQALPSRAGGSDWQFWLPEKLVTISGISEGLSDGHRPAGEWTTLNRAGAGKGLSSPVLHDLGIRQSLEATDVDGSLDSASSGGGSTNTRLSGFSTASLSSEASVGTRQPVSHFGGGPRSKICSRRRRCRDSTPPFPPTPPAARFTGRWAPSAKAFAAPRCQRGWAPAWCAGERLRPPS